MKFQKTLLSKITKTPEETMKLGEQIIRKLPKGSNFIILKGELGAGKTVLVKGMARALGIKEVIKSPTFGYSRSYKTNKNNKLIHYDLYLIKKIKSKDLLSLLSEDSEDNIVVLEWGDKLPNIPNSIYVTIDTIFENAREIEVKLI